MWIRVFLGLVALSFIAFGLWSLMDPIGMTGSLGVEVGGPNGAFEMRGIYGGVSLGAAALASAGALNAGMVRPALWFLVAYMGGYCFARPLAWTMGSAPTQDFILFIAFEALVLLIALAGLFARRSDASTHG